MVDFGLKFIQEKDEEGQYMFTLDPLVLHI